MYVTIHTTFCFYAGRIELKKPCLITGILDCCREFAPHAEELATGEGELVRKYEPKSKSPRSTLVQKLILYACERNMEAYDGNDKHGNEFICRNKTMWTESLRVKMHSALCMIPPPRISAKLVCTQSQIMSGVLTGCVLKHLPTPFLELNEFCRLVSRAVVDSKGDKQMMVRWGCNKYDYEMLHLEVSNLYVRAHC